MRVAYILLVVAVVTANDGRVAGQTLADAPRPVPLTRPEMKQLLEDMKVRNPRIPLPDPTDEDGVQLDAPGGSYESLLRYYYMPSGERRGGNRGGVGRERDPNLSLDYAFKTQLFWIVSRANNCQYCQGHQESKLLRAGQTEDQIAALDGDWVEFLPEQQAAFAFARKFTFQPHLLSDADIDSLRPYYSELQILEMILSMAANNSINRWKEGVGVPQSTGGGGFGRGQTPAGEAQHTYLTPTSEQYRNKISKVAPVVFDEKTGEPTRLTLSQRPAMESRAEVEKALAACRMRQPRLSLVEDVEARENVAPDWPDSPLPQWVRLIANFPIEGRATVSRIRSTEETGDLTPLLKAELSWIIARQDRAWYAVAQAKRRLEELGWSDDQVFTLDGDWSEFSPTQRALFTMARNLSSSPVILTDNQVAEAVKLAGPRDVVQLVAYTAHRASFDRITEAAGLQPD